MKIMIIINETRVSTYAVPVASVASGPTTVAMATAMAAATAPTAAAAAAAVAAAVAAAAATFLRGQWGLVSDLFLCAPGRIFRLQLLHLLRCG